MADPDKLRQFMTKMIGDIGAAVSVPLVRTGMRLGLYKAMDGAGPITSVALAEKAGISERYAREWLAQNAASGYLTYEPSGKTFELPPEQAMAFAREDSHVYIGGTIEAVCAIYPTQPKVEQAFLSGGGIEWGEHAGCLFCAVGAMLRPRYIANILQKWLPALNGVKAKLEVGAAVADVGCGTGHSTLIMAKAFPNSTFGGYDFHEPSIDHARDQARLTEGIDNVRFEVATAKNFPARDLDLVTFFDVLHDLGDPVGAAVHVRQSLKPDGVWMLMEPLAGDATEDNLTPVGRIAYALSAMACIPVSLSQEVGAALGAQAGQKRLTEVIKRGGFREVRRAAETPFNMVLEAGFEKRARLSCGRQLLALVVRPRASVRSDRRRHPCRRCCSRFSLRRSPSGQPSLRLWACCRTSRPVSTSASRRRVCSSAATRSA
jgi:ubiquinone/menaquinone biosynthesis C-methylase UbiE